MKHKLTDKQLAVYVFMRDYFRENDMLPPERVLAQHFGWASRASATVHRQSLENKGYLERNAIGKFRFAREAAK